MNAKKLIILIAIKAAVIALVGVIVLWYMFK